MEQLSLIGEEDIVPRSGAKKYKENVLERKEREHTDENIQRFLQLQQLPYEAKASHADYIGVKWQDIPQTNEQMTFDDINGSGADEK